MSTQRLRDDAGDADVRTIGQGMKRFVPLLAIAAVVLLALLQRGTGSDVAIAIRDHRSHVQVAGEGVVSRLLPDDRDGSRHQRFILRLASGATVLVAHNIDLAPRVTAIALGDTVAFNGEYEWNGSGGVIHWTHRDPAGRHVAGWLRHAGQLVQ